MSVITISRQSGSEGDKVAHLLCERLGYAYFDKYLMVKLAQEMGWNSEKLFDESEDQHHAASLLDKILGSFTLPFSLTGGYQSPLPSESLESLKVRQVEQLIISAYEHGDVVIVGRGGQVILADKADVLHVRVVAPLEKRIQTWIRFSRGDTTRTCSTSGLPARTTCPPRPTMTTLPCSYADMMSCSTCLTFKDSKDSLGRGD